MCLGRMVLWQREHVGELGQRIDIGGRSRSRIAAAPRPFVGAGGASPRHSGPVSVDYHPSSRAGLPRGARSSPRGRRPSICPVQAARPRPWSRRWEPSTPPQ